MNTKSILLYVTVLVCVCSFTKVTDPNYRIIVDDQFTHEFYISQKEIKQEKTNKEYYWYKSGEIHNTLGSNGGKLLDGIYKKKYTNNQLAESGVFSEGLKIKTWKNWHPNGQLKNITEWSDGKKNGSFKTYSEKGELELKGHFNNNKKSGKWISYTSKDTLNYKKGEVIPDKVKNEEPTKAKILFNKVFKKKETKEKQEPSKIKQLYNKVFKKKGTSKQKKVKKETKKTVKKKASK